MTKSVVVNKFEKGRILQGTLEDEHDDLTLMLNNKPIFIHKGKKASFNVKLPDDKSKIKLKAIDKLGNETLAIFHSGQQYIRSSSLRLACNNSNYVADNGENALISKISKPEIHLYGWSY